MIEIFLKSSMGIFGETSKTSSAVPTGQIRDRTRDGYFFRGSAEGRATRWNGACGIRAWNKLLAELERYAGSRLHPVSGPRHSVSLVQLSALLRDEKYWL